MDPTDPLAVEEFLAVAELDGNPRNARIFLAAPLTRAEIEAIFAGHIEHTDIVTWNSREQAVLARRQERLGALMLRDVEGLSTEETAEALDLSVPAVKSRLLRARLQLRERLNRYFKRNGSGDGKREVL